MPFFLLPLSQSIVLQLLTRELRKFSNPWKPSELSPRQKQKWFSHKMLIPLFWTRYFLSSPTEIMNISAKQTDKFLRDTKAVIREARLLRMKSVATSRIKPSHHDDCSNARSRHTTMKKNIPSKKIDVPSTTKKTRRNKTLCKKSNEISSIIRELKQVKQSIVADMDKNNKSQSSSFSESELRSIKSFFQACSTLLTSFDEQPRHEEQKNEGEEERIVDMRRKVQRRRSSSSSSSSASSVRFDLSRNETFHF